MSSTALNLSRSQLGYFRAAGSACCLTSRAGRRGRVRAGLTLVELLVVMAIVSVLIALLIPAVQSVRASARRTQCLNNLRQVMLAAINFESARGHLPSGAISREYPEVPWTPHNYYRWSALAHSLPFLENGAAYDALHMEVPLFGIDFQVTRQNRGGVAMRVAEFLCPSDTSESSNPHFGPTNYAACAGTGNDGGSPFDTDGLFYINSDTKLAAIEDGQSHTLAFSEMIQGRTPPAMTPRDEADPNFVYGFARAVPLTEEACENTALWNFTQPRGFSWANGEYRSALYNHHRPPNARQFDCVSAIISGDLAHIHSAYGWTTARSWHSGGVNGALADGSVRFLSDSIDVAAWQALATRAGHE